MTQLHEPQVRVAALSLFTRVAALPLAIGAVFPVAAQTQLAQAATEPQLRETVVTATRVARPLADLVADVSIVDR